MKRNINFKKTVLIYSMLLTLILVMISSLLNYFTTRQVIKEESENGIQNAVSQLVNSNDIMMNDLIKSISTIIEDSHIDTFSEQFSYLEYTKKSQVYNKLSEILNINVYFTSCYAYYPKSDKIIDVNTYSPRFISVEQCDNIKLIKHSYDEFITNQKENKSDIFPVDTGDSTEWMIVIPLNPYQYEQGVLMVTVSPGYFYSNLNTLHFNEHLNVYIVNSNNQTLNCELPQSIFNTNLYRDLYKKSEGRDIIKTNSQKYLVGYITSNYTNWKYIYDIELKVIYEKLYLLAYVTGLSVLFCLIVGVALCFSLADLTYKPIKNIANIFETDETHTDGLSTIKNGIEQLLNDNQTLNQQIYENKSILKHSFFISLLNGDFQEYSDFQQQFNTYDIPFKNNSYYFILIFSVEPEEGTMVSYNPQQLLMFELLFEDNLHSSFNSFKDAHIQRIKTSTDTQLFIFSFETQPENKKKIKQCIEDTCNETKKVAKLSLSIGCSDIEFGADKISKLYKQAESALKYRYIAGYGKVIYFMDLPKNMLYHYPYSIEKKIHSFIKKGEFNKINDSLYEFNDYIIKNLVELSQCRFFFMHLLSGILQDINELNGAYIKNTNQDLLFEKILSSKTTTEIIHIIDDYVKYVAIIVNQQQITKSNEIAQAVESFIEENYCKSDLCLDMISDKLNYSTSYLSKVFKFSKDVSIKDYITEKRLNRACYLLKNTDDKLKNVAASVGYTQQRSFIEIFKKYKGVTPSEYRNTKLSTKK